MLRFTYRQLDVFSATPLKGNPLAVVHGADALTKAEMQAIAHWTNLSETAFLLAPGSERADYKVRIFTPAREIPFAGHPTLGSCAAWLEAGGVPKGSEIVQECGAGLIRIRPGANRLAFAAPPTVQREVDTETLAQIALALRIAPEAITAARWLHNAAPSWVAIMLGSRAEVLALKPDFNAMGALMVGVIAPSDQPGLDYEVRGFAPADGIPEDPVTGSLNAGLAQWLIGAGLAPPSYIAAQGTCLGRSGKVFVEQDGQEIWIGGASVTTITGHLTI
jgi:PhzF family phenazine biosynthesis protein